ncbi:MAG: 16S rRNA (guanine(527)-N(7))-methyltransferase RsmG [Candidatus Dormibacteria bacterium]
MDSGDALGPAGLDVASRPQQERYLDLLYRANLSLNLTRVPREEAWERHIEQSLSLIALRSWRPGELVVDVGSGGGLPGIPLAIGLPRVNFLLVERQLNKAAFLERCREELGLEKVVVAARDAGELGCDRDHPKAQAVIGRAVAPPLKLVPLVAPLLAEGGEALLMVGESFRVDPSLLRLCERLRLSPPQLQVTSAARVLRFHR